MVRIVLAIGRRLGARRKRTAARELQERLAADRPRAPRPLVLSRSGFTIGFVTAIAVATSPRWRKNSGCVVLVLRLPDRAGTRGTLMPMKPFSGTYIATSGPMPAAHARPEARK